MPNFNWFSGGGAPSGDVLPSRVEVTKVNFGGFDPATKVGRMGLAAMLEVMGQGGLILAEVARQIGISAIGDATRSERLVVVALENELHAFPDGAPRDWLANPDETFQEMIKNVKFNGAEDGTG